MANTTDIKFASLRVDGWRQFERIELELHPQLTVITGSNGAGKSTLLNIFSGHFGYQRAFLATPFRDSSGGYRFLPGVVEFFLKPTQLPNARPDFHRVGEITYTNNTTSVAHIPQQGNIQYQLSIVNRQQVQGFHVSSHRRLPNYRPVGQIPTVPMLPQQAYDHFNGETTNDFNGGQSQHSTTYRIKEALISMATFGPGSKYIQPNIVIMEAFEGFSAILRKILPEEVGFDGLSIRTPDVVLVTKSGEFLLDAASGGLTALIDLAWQIYMFSLRGDSFVVTIDEPENHLHPAMQRTLMSNLIKTFPRVQFIVATHSPFIVSALRDARVYVLKYKDHLNNNLSPQQTRLVSSIRLDEANLAGTASQILRDVLGLPTTYPEWVSKGIEAIIDSHRNRPFNEELLASIRHELKRSGYGDLYPDVASALSKP